MATHRGKEVPSVCLEILPSVRDLLGYIVYMLIGLTIALR